MDSSDYQLKKDPLDVPKQALEVHRKIVSALKNLESLDCSCLDPLFVAGFSDVLSLYQIFQQLVIAHSSMNVSCKQGCSYCCYHWVEDVNSFEAEIIADYIKRNMPEKVNSIIEICKDDTAELERLLNVVSAKISESKDDEADQIDEFELLLTVFYQMKRPCPLLDDNNSCSVYPVRPLTCRVYMSFADPLHCSPEYINDEEVSTYLLNLEEDANEILDRLHFRYRKDENDTGLRSMLIGYLTGKW